MIFKKMQALFGEGFRFASRAPLRGARALRAGRQKKDLILFAPAGAKSRELRFGQLYHQRLRRDL
jgi:hypothetical protein